MADSDAILAALLGNNPGAYDPISGFQKATAANDIYKMAAAPVLGAKFDTSTWSPTETFGATAAQAFLGTLLHGLGQQKEDEQLMKIASIYPQLAKDPLSVAMPEGVDSNAFSALKLGMLRANQAKEEKLAEKYADAVFGLKIKEQEARLGELGKIKGRQEGYGFGPLGESEDLASTSAALDPEDPRYKIKQDKLKEVQSMGDAQARIEQLGPVKTYQELLPVYERMDALSTSTDKASVSTAVTLHPPLR